MSESTLLLVLYQENAELSLYFLCFPKYDCVLKLYLSHMFHQNMPKPGALDQIYQ